MQNENNQKRLLAIVVENPLPDASGNTLMDRIGDPKRVQLETLIDGLEKMTDRGPGFWYAVGIAECRAGIP